MMKFLGYIFKGALIVFLTSGIAMATQIPAKDVSVNSSNFTKNLGVGDTSVQHALATLDQIPSSGYKNFTNNETYDITWTYNLSVDAINASSTNITTTQIVEGSRMYYTDNRSRAALSVGWGLNFNNTTGVISAWYNVTNATSDTGFTHSGTTIYPTNWTTDRVGIGTTAPNYKLDTQVDVSGSGGAYYTTVANFQNSNTTNGAVAMCIQGYSNETNTAFGRNKSGSSIIFQNLNSTDGNYNLFAFTNAVDAIAASVTGISVTQGGAGVAEGALALQVRNVPRGLFEAMRIDKNGNIGIGNAAPLSKFDIRGNSVAGTGFALRIQDSTPSNRMVVLDNGNVGIGTTAPTTLLNVYANTGSNAGMVFQNDGGNAILTIQAPTSGVGRPVSLFNDGATTYGAITLERTSSKIFATTARNDFIFYLPTSTNNLVFGTNNRETMRINPNGNVGIGMTNPLAKLDVRGDSVAGTGFAFRIADSTPTDRMVVLDNGNVGIGTTAPVGTLQVGDAGSLFVSASGNVGVGTTAPTRKLYVSGAIGSASQIDVGEYLKLNDEKQIVFGNANKVRSFYNSASNGLILANDTTVHKFYFGINSGNVGIGTTAPTAKLVIKGTDSTPSQSLYLSAGAGSTAGGSPLTIVSPGGNCYSCGPNDTGVWGCTLKACP